MAKKAKLKVYVGTAHDGVTIFITAAKKRYAQSQSSTEVVRVKFNRAGVASTVRGIFDNLCEPKTKKVPHERSVNLG